jgi:mRNA interferase HigB
VYIVTIEHLDAARAKYKDATRAIDEWQDIVEGARWRHIEEVREIYKSADAVDGYVIFEICGNRYRLVTVIHWAKTTKKKRTMGHVYIRSFLTHKEYDNPTNWDREYGTKKGKK